jgi:hypothetical protein
MERERNREILPSCPKSVTGCVFPVDLQEKDRERMLVIHDSHPWNLNAPFAEKYKSKKKILTLGRLLDVISFRGFLASQAKC